MDKLSAAKMQPDVLSLCSGEKRKLAIVSVSLEYVGRFLREPASFLRTSSNLPVDAKVVDCVFDRDYQVLRLVVESESFQEVSAGSQLPDFQVLFTRVDQRLPEITVYHGRPDQKLGKCEVAVDLLSLEKIGGGC